MIKTHFIDQLKSFKNLKRLESSKNGCCNKHSRSILPGTINRASVDMGRFPLCLYMLEFLEYCCRNSKRMSWKTSARINRRRRIKRQVFLTNMLDDDILRVGRPSGWCRFQPIVVTQLKTGVFKKQLL